MGSLNQFLIVTFSQPPSSSNCFGYLHPHPLPPQSPFRCGWSPLQRLWCLFRQISFFICILVCLTDANLLIKISPKESGNSCLRFLCKVLKFGDIIAGNLFCSVSINVTVWKCWVSLKLYLPRNVVFQPVKPSNKIYIPWQHNENCQRFAKSPDGKQVFFFLVFKYHSRNKSNITTAADLGHQQLIILTRKRCCHFVRSLLHTLLWCIGRGKKPIQPRFIGKHLSFTLSNQSN